LALDWVKQYENGTSYHYAEPRHSTEAITQDAIDIIHNHANKQYSNSNLRSEDHQPLFLYVSYTAAHSPLQPRLEDINKCNHIKHLWRREFCGLVVGLE
jgi:hypothetical protein